MVLLSIPVTGRAYCQCQVLCYNYCLFAFESACYCDFQCLTQKMESQNYQDHHNCCQEVTGEIMIEVWISTLHIWP